MAGFRREGKVNTELSVALPPPWELHRRRRSLSDCDGWKKASATFILIAHLTANICRMEHSRKKTAEEVKNCLCRAINLFCLPYTLRCVFSIYAVRVLSRSKNKQNERAPAVSMKDLPVLCDLSRESCKKSIKRGAGVNFRESARRLVIDMQERQLL